MIKIIQNAKGLSITNTLGNMEFFNRLLNLYKEEWGILVAKTIRKDIVNGLCSDIQSATYNNSIIGSYCIFETNVGNVKRNKVPKLIDVYCKMDLDSPNIESVLKTYAMKKIVSSDIKEIIFCTRNLNVKSFYNKFSWEIVDSIPVNGKEAITLLWKRKNNKYFWNE
jgi:hypothetical protein